MRDCITTVSPKVAPMPVHAILYPMFALVLLTFLVLILIPLARFRSAGKREVSIGDFRYGESSAVPGHVALPNRNYMNLLELPVLFYTACLLIFTTGVTTSSMVTLAWVYVGMRTVHSLVHLSYNNVLHRLALFVGSTFVLLALWVNAFLALSGAPAVHA